MNEQTTIQTLHKQGETNASIALILKVHRNTVRNVLKRETIREKQSRVKPSRFDKYKEQIKDWLDQNITNLRILQTFPLYPKSPIRPMSEGSLGAHGVPEEACCTPPV